MEGAHRTEMYCIDGTAKSMCSPAWQLLQTRIGDTLMLYLLLHVSMFSTLENDCFFQLTGYPVTLAARAVKKTSQVQQGRLSMKQYYEKYTADFSVGVASRHRKRMKLMKNGEETNEIGARGVHEGTNAAKSVRPSSWQRKKYKRAKERGDESTVRELELQRDVKQTKYDSQQLSTAVSSLHQTRESRDSRKCTRKIEHYRHPRYVLRPSEMVIPRQSMFYSRRYSRKGGLPSERTSHCFHYELFAPR